jgi:hypothetical protein
MPDSDRDIQRWLNTLSEAELRGVRDVFVSFVESDRGGFRDAVNVTGGPLPVNLSCLAGNHPRDGNWYYQWATCRTYNYTGQGYPRWQPTVRKRGSILTPDRDGNGRAMKGVMSKDRWDRLKHLANANGQVKIPVHHLMFRATHPDIAIPDNMGQGASMSHLCDRRECVRSEHLELTEHHVDNLERQRCTGVILIVAADVIVHEVPCPHSVGETNARRIDSSCRKIRMVCLPNDAIEHLVGTFQTILALAALPFSQSQ